jgi:hypothetical protein
MEGLTVHVVAAIRAEGPEYTELPYEAHLADSRRSVATIVEGLRDDRPPGAEALAHAARLGRERAKIGLPLLAGINGYHVAYRELWSFLLDRTQDRDPALRAELTTAVVALWTWVHHLSAEFANAYSRELAQMEATRQGLRSRLVSLLESGNPGGERAIRVAESLDFRADGDFVAVVSGPATVDSVEAVHLGLPQTNGIAHCALDMSGNVVLLIQGDQAARFVGAVRDVVGANVGVGAQRFGLVGAANSIRDARSALRTTGPQTPIRDFTRDWCLSLIGAEPDRIEVFVGQAVSTATDNPHLAEAVRAFAESEFSITATAKRIHLHPNSAKYRLDRWSRLTGLNVQTPDGLMASVVAIALADRISGR